MKTLEQLIIDLTNALERNTGAIVAQGLVPGPAENTPVTGEGSTPETAEEELTPAQKAARTRARNKAKKEAEEAAAKEAAAAAPPAQDPPPATGPVVGQPPAPDPTQAQGPATGPVTGPVVGQAQATAPQQSAQDFKALQTRAAEVSRILGTRAGEIMVALGNFTDVNGAVVTRISALQEQDYPAFFGHLDQLVASAQGS